MQVNPHDGWDDAFDNTNIFGEPLDDDYNRALELAEKVVAAMPTAFWINANTKEAQDHKKFVLDTILALRT